MEGRFRSIVPAGAIWNEKVFSFLLSLECICAIVKKAILKVRESKT